MCLFRREISLRNREVCVHSNNCKSAYMSSFSRYEIYCFGKELCKSNSVVQDKSMNLRTLLHLEKKLQ